MAFEIILVDPPDAPTYVTIAVKALHLEELQMNPNQIAVALNVDRTTAVRALRWIKDESVYASSIPHKTQR